MFASCGHRDTTFWAAPLVLAVLKEPGVVAVQPGVAVEALFGAVEELLAFAAAAVEQTAVVEVQPAFANPPPDVALTLGESLVAGALPGAVFAEPAPSGLSHSG